MADKLNGMRLRLCAVAWELAEMGHLTSEGADRISQRVAEVAPAEIAAWARQMLTVGRKAS